MKLVNVGLVDALSARMATRTLCRVYAGDPVTNWTLIDRGHGGWKVEGGWTKMMNAVPGKRQAIARDSAYVSACLAQPALTMSPIFCKDTPWVMPASRRAVAWYSVWNLEILAAVRVGEKSQGELVRGRRRRTSGRRSGGRGRGGAQTLRQGALNWRPMRPDSLTRRTVLRGMGKRTPLTSMAADAPLSGSYSCARAGRRVAAETVRAAAAASERVHGGPGKGGECWRTYCLGGGGEERKEQRDEAGEAAPERCPHLGAAVKELSRSAPRGLPFVGGRSGGEG